MMHPYDDDDNFIYVSKKKHKLAEGNNPSTNRGHTKKVKKIKKIRKGKLKKTIYIKLYT